MFRSLLPSKLFAILALTAVLGAAPAGGEMSCHDCVMYAASYFDDCMANPDLSHGTCAERCQSMVEICEQGPCKEEPE